MTFRLYARFYAKFGRKQSVVWIYFSPYTITPNEKRTSTTYGRFFDSLESLEEWFYALAKELSLGRASSLKVTFSGNVKDNSTMYSAVCPMLQSIFLSVRSLHVNTRDHNQCLIADYDLTVLLEHFPNVQNLSLCLYNPNLFPFACRQIANMKKLEEFTLIKCHQDEPSAGAFRLTPCVGQILANSIQDLTKLQSIRFLGGGETWVVGKPWEQILCVLGSRRSDVEASFADGLRGQFEEQQWKTLNEGPTHDQVLSCTAQRHNLQVSLTSDCVTLDYDGGALGPWLEALETLRKFNRYDCFQTLLLQLAPELALLGKQNQLGQEHDQQQPRVRQQQQQQEEKKTAPSPRF